MRRLVWVVVVGLLGVACRQPAASENDAGVVAMDGAGVVADAGDVDEPTVDAGVLDASVTDAAPLDGSDVVPEPDEPDAAVPNASVEDASIPDAGLPDATVDVPDAAVVVPPSPLQVFFNAPAGTGAPDTSLEAVLKDLLARAVSGSSVRVSLFTFTRSTMANAMVAAQARGVDVRVVLDGHNAAYAAYTTLVNGLGASHVTLCGTAANGSCVGTGINHSKYFLFSQLDDGSHDVVVQSSANLSNPMLEEHNNLVVVRNDVPLHAGYLAVWEAQRLQHQNLNFYHVVVGTQPVRTYFFPRQDADTVVSVLGNVVCTGGGKIRVAMAFFTDGRVEVARKLAAKKAEGCDVRVLLRQDSTTPGSSVLTALANGGVQHWKLTATAAHATIHSKVLIIDSLYDTGTGPTPRKLVFTGSHNYTGPALTGNDEQLMRIDDATAFAKYAENWNAIRATVP
jgi:phosphatidylserine/phosphatidylglycerophosphate/cardiolipin synthase-like enzyme